MPTITHYPQTAINRNLIEWLVAQQMWDSESNMSGGLKDLYEHVRAVISTHRAVCAWVMRDGMTLIGVAMIEQREVCGLHLFVKKEFRRLGYGEQLLNEAFSASLPFGVFYTDAAKQLYEKYNLPDVSELL